MRLSRGRSGLELVELVEDRTEGLDRSFISFDHDLLRKTHVSLWRRNAHERAEFVGHSQALETVLKWGINERSYTRHNGTYSDLAKVWTQLLSCEDHEQNIPIPDILHVTVVRWGFSDVRLCVF